MRGPFVLLVALMGLVAGALSGCVDCTSGPPVTARGITEGTDVDGDGSYELTIRLREGPGGPPVAGAGVVVYWSGLDADQWNGPRVEVGPGRVVVEPGDLPPTVDPDHVVRLYSGASGDVRARVPAGRIVGLVAAKDGYTEEWVAAMATGASGGAGGIEVPLYRSQLTATLEGLLAPGGVSTGRVTGGGHVWTAQPAPFGQTAEAHKGYGARLAGVTVTLTWTNSPFGYGDLAFALGPDASDATFVRDETTNLEPGAQTETATLSAEDLRQYSLIAAPDLHVGPATGTAFFSPGGLPYKLVLEAQFDRAVALRNQCLGSGGADDDQTGVGAPAAGVAAAVAALGTAAFVRRRRAE